MKQEFQCAIELQLFDDRIKIVAVAALLQFSVDKLINFYASDDVIYCLLSEVFKYQLICQLCIIGGHS